MAEDTATTNVHEPQILLALVHASPLAIYTVDLAGIVTMWNPAAERIFGWSAAEVLGRFLPIVPTDLQESFLALRQTVQAGRSLTNIEAVLVRKDGTPIEASVSTAPLCDAGGAVNGIMVIAEDIRERKRADAALRQAEMRFRTLVEQLPAIAYIAALDESSSTLYTSPQIETMLGFSQAEWMANHDLWHKQIHPDDRERVLEDMARSHASGAPVPSEYRMLARDGHAVWFHDLATIVRDEAGQPLFMQGIMFDISDLKRAEAALRRSEAQNRALLNAMPDMLFRVSRDGACLAYQAQGGGAPRTNLFVGSHLAEVFPPDVAIRLMPAIDSALQSGALQSVEYEIVVDGAPCDHEARIVVSGEDEVLIIVRDMTERKAVERMKHEFVALVSHELRTPLTSIRGALGLLAGGVAGSLPAQARAMIEIAHKNSERLVRLINDILDIEKIEAGKLEFKLQPIELLPLVEQAVAENRAYAEELRVDFVLRSSAVGAWVNADADRLLQALTNLLANAAKFSPPGAAVDVAVERHASALRVAISDRGPGIAEPFRARIFHKFAQADSSSTRQKSGTGLGLSITKAIVEKLGGRISFETTIGRVTTFFLDLPEWRAPGTATGARTRRVARKPAAHRRSARPV